MTIWKLRNNNPLRKSYVVNNIKLNEFDALIRITVEMSKYLYPYIREILKSKEDIEDISTVILIKASNSLSLILLIT